MNLTWHIVAKDLRRMAGPAALWLACVLAASIWFRLQPFASPGDSAGGPSPILVSTCGLVLIVQLLGLYVLGGALVMEDPMVSSTAFWLTRPISPQRLLFAKLLAALALFVAVPVACLAGMWFAYGAGVQQVVVAAAQYALIHGAVLLGAIAIASISTSLLQFLPWTLGLVVLWWSLVGWTEWVSEGRHMHDAHPNAILGQIAPACPVALLVARCTVRRREWAVVAVVGVLAVAAGIRIAHPYVAESRMPEGAVVPVVPNRVTRIEAKPIPSVSIFGSSQRDANGSYRIPAQAWVAERSNEHSRGLFSLDGRKLERTLALRMGADTVEWRLVAHDPPAAALRTDPLPALAGTWASVAVAGEVPLHVGQAISVDASRVVIREIVRLDNGDCRVLLEQHDMVADRVWGIGDVVRDEFAILDRARGRARVLDAPRVDRGWLDWQLVKILHVTIPADALPERESDARIVQVRFRSAEPLTFPNSVGGAE